MYKNEFEKLLQKSLPQIVLLYGENDFFKEYYANFYLEKLFAKESALIQNFEEYNFEQAKNYLSQSSLFGGVNLYILRSDKKIAKKELETLIDLTKKTHTNYFIYIYEGSSSNAKSLQSLFSEKNGAIWLRFFEANFNEVRQIALNKAKALKLDIEPYALTYLINMLNFNITLILKELEKLAILGRKIEVKDIDDLVYSSAPLSVSKVITALFQKKEITQSLQKLLELGEDEFAILRSIQQYLEQIFLFWSYIKLKGTPNSKEILGYQLPKQIENELASIAVRFKQEKLLAIFKESVELELLMKKNSANKQSLLLSKLAKMKELL